MLLLVCMQSIAAVMEPRNAFPTTFGFAVSTSGFAAAASTALPAAVKLEQQADDSDPILEPQQPHEDGLSVAVGGGAEQGKPKVATVSPTPSVNVPLTPDAQDTASHVGWRGLLEISQHSGSSGVLGARAVVSRAERLAHY